MNSVLATTLSSVYLAMRHIFPDVPISAGAFEPLTILKPEGTFLDAQISAPGLRLRGGSLSAHRRSGVSRWCRRCRTR
jgi:N-methylhydantoinase B/oxoprolinase/acetone carboxylase alpha subunit